jgi:hypothetical protein
MPARRSFFKSRLHHPDFAHVAGHLLPRPDTSPDAGDIEHIVNRVLKAGCECWS